MIRERLWAAGVDTEELPDAAAAFQAYEALAGDDVGSRGTPDKGALHSAVQRLREADARVAVPVALAVAALALGLRWLRRRRRQRGSGARAGQGAKAAPLKPLPV
jgi:hypothetical protein